jgi:predicted aspartyl protease
MGEVREQITLINSYDLAKQGEGVITQEQIRQVTVEAVVDTGTMSLIMGEETCRRLGLAIEREGVVSLAGGARKSCKVTGPVEIRWKDRDTACKAIVLSGKEEILMGCIPLEDMDLMVNPVERCLAGAHGDEWVRYVRGGIRDWGLETGE